MNIWRGLVFSRRHLWEHVLRTNLADAFYKVAVPVCFFTGKYDLTANPVLSRELFGRVEAPLKHYYTFEHSAHSPLFEEPDRAIGILVRDVTGRTKAE